MRISARTIGSIVILDLKGRLTVGAQTQKIQDEVRALIRQKKVNVILNLRQIDSLDCSGIGALVSSYRIVGGEGGQLKLLGVSVRHRRMLTLVGLLTVFDVYESEQDALASFLGSATRIPLAFHPSDATATS